MAAITKQLCPNGSGAFHRWLGHTFTQLDPDTYDGIFSPNEEYDGATLLPQIQCPVLLLQSALMPDEDVKRALKQLKEGYVARFDGITHELHLDPQGYQVVNEICLFLESLR